MQTRYLFLHQVKTAGKTLEKFFLRQYRADFCKTTLVFPDETVDNIFSILDSTDHEKIEKLNNAKIITGHFPYGLHRLLSGESRYVTLLRDPVARTRSYYAYSLRNYGSKICAYLHDNNISFRQFIEMEASDIQKAGVHELNYILEDGQSQMIAGLDQLVGSNPYPNLLEECEKNIKEKFDFVGVTELFDDSFIHIANTIGKGSFNVYMTENRSKVRVEVSEQEKNIILERNPTDAILHGKYFKAVKADSTDFMHKLAKIYLYGGSRAAEMYAKVRN